MSLLDICIAEVALLLKENYWPLGSYNFDENNPFKALPSSINEELIAAVIRITPSGALTVADLYPILSSGRVKTFQLENIAINFEEFEGILTALSIQGIHLNTLILDDIHFKTSSDVYHISCSSRQEADMIYRAASAIECLLALSPNLEKIKIGIPFDLKAIQKVPALKHIELNFVPKCDLYDMIQQYDELYIPNDTITYVSILKSPRFTLPADEVAFILQYCIELRSFDNDVSEALELLHGAELFDGSLCKQYKLQKLVLGDMARLPDSAVASVRVMHIASLTCPHLKELEVLVNDHHAVAALRYFKNLESLLVQWEPVVTAGDFRMSLLLVLENIGVKLTKLKILNFNRVDFEVIGRSCPNLERLTVEYEKEVASEICPAFEKLEELYLESSDFIGPAKQTLLQLLIYSKDIHYISLENVVCLNDELLKQILKANNLSKLKEAFFVDCSLEAEGLKHFIESCKSLEFLKFSSHRLSFREAADVVHSINPFIVIADSSF